MSSNAGNNCHGTVSNGLGNLRWPLSDATCAEIPHGDPMLMPLGYNGGLTRTMAIPASSAAFDAGTFANCPETDQRGVLRAQGLGCDAGAYELVPALAHRRDVHSAYFF